MAQHTKIEWCDHTANLWHGCTEVHAGCDNCYARVLSERWGRDIWGNDKPRMEIKSVWKDLVKFQKLAAAENTIKTVFVGSMMDIFEKPMPVFDSNGNKLKFDAFPDLSLDTHMLRLKLFSEIVPASPNLLFLFLTKRPSNINKYIPDSWKKDPPANVMFGTSPVNDETFDKLVPQLLAVKGKHFLSIEPQLGSVSLPINFKIDWIIQGGESGHHKRPFDLSWAYSLKNECACLGIPYFFKQIDKVKPIPQDLMIRQFPHTIKI